MIEISRLHELLTYDAETGLFHWRIHRNGHVRAGDIAGGREPNGYIQIRIDDRLVRAHRIAWAMHYGRWPSNDIDHRDLDKGNNRIANLREATRSQNNANRMLVPKGVRCLRGKYYQAEININGKKKYLGSFPSAADAAEAYKAAHRAAWGEFSNCG